MAEEKARISVSLLGNQHGKGYKPTPEQKKRKSEVDKRWRASQKDSESGA